MDKKIPCIVGPTAVGKTDFALELARQIVKAKKTEVELVSVDSKQVYKGLEILTGADIPDGWELNKHDQDHSFYSSPDKNIRLHGVSILELSMPWSLMEFREFLEKIVNFSQKNGSQVVLVGGTGLYYQRSFDYDLTNVGPDEEIRQRAEKMTVAQLQDWLKKLNKQSFSAMNNSDVNNPRRLVRAIERELGQSEFETADETPLNGFSPIYLGLSANLETLGERINKRVSARFELALEEVKKIMNSGAKVSSTARSTIGFELLEKFIKGEISEEECKQSWALKELQYAKRQLTWWKKHQVIWLSSSQTESDLLSLIKSNLQEF